MTIINYFDLQYLKKYLIIFNIFMMDRFVHIEKKYLSSSMKPFLSEICDSPAINEKEQLNFFETSRLLYFSIEFSVGWNRINLVVYVFAFHKPLKIKIWLTDKMRKVQTESASRLVKISTET